MNPLIEEELTVIDTYLDGASEEELESSKQTFKVIDLDSLNWTFRKLSALKVKETEIKKLAQKERDRIEYWENKELASINQSVEFFKMLISEYHAAVLSENPKQKTLSTPYGKSKSRISKAQPEATNEDVLLQYVKENEMTEFIKESLKWGDFKKTLKVVSAPGEKDVIVDENGQVVPGVIVKPESITFSAEVE